MNSDDLKNLNSITDKIKTINKKFLLLNLLRKAKIEYDNNNFDGCADYCKNILNTDSENSIALRGLGCCAQIAGDFESAVEYYKKALKYSKNKEIEYTLIGTVYYNENNYDKAIKYYNLAIDINDNYDIAYEERNQTMLERHLQIADLQDELIKKEIL